MSSFDIVLRAAQHDCAQTVADLTDPQKGVLEKQAAFERVRQCPLHCQSLLESRAREAQHYCARLAKLQQKQDGARNDTAVILTGAHA